MDFPKPLKYSREGNLTRAFFDKEEVKRFLLENPQEEFSVYGKDGEFLAVAHMTQAMRGEVFCPDEDTIATQLPS